MDVSKIKKIFSYEAQILPRINILRKEIEQAKEQCRARAGSPVADSPEGGATTIRASADIPEGGAPAICAGAESPAGGARKSSGRSRAARYGNLHYCSAEFASCLSLLIVFSSRMLRQLMDLAKGRKIKGNSALLRSSGLFDEVWYLAQNPDVARTKVDPVLHYLRHGGFEGRNPGPHFDGDWYLSAYKDVKKSGINPLVHYLKHGKAEGRLKQPMNSK